MSELKTLTEELLLLNKHLSDRYQLARETGEKGDFYKEVKPFADKVKEVSDLWEIKAKEWILEEQPKHIHFPQIIHTIENLELVSVQAFFPETSYKRFVSYIQSIDYVLHSVLEEI
ncbi:hypothetical protein JOC86_000842 [Bacillus pakistanensis]|uniref:DUF1798 family protein n=1 Tax=Rossellomorea pakistanensis TaxID=992288 RepID=A0ABS2N8X8_9BACI|nr:YppE family protein [Bacillus pakistanensis]MBM7584305.1 hypothetical protein [Bacillus pakistanensis]